MGDHAFTLHENQASSLSEQHSWHQKGLVQLVWMALLPDSVHHHRHPNRSANLRAHNDSLQRMVDLLRITICSHAHSIFATKGKTRANLGKDQSTLDTHDN